jgi:uncharacterized protein YggE
MIRTTFARNIARDAKRAIGSVIAALIAVAAISVDASAQLQQSQRAQAPRVVVVGEGSVTVAPDLAQIRSGVTVKAKTVKEATDSTSKTMTAIMAALAEAGIATKDIQTARFSIQPVYAAPEPRAEQKLVGYMVSNQVHVKIRELDKVGPILDRLVAAGATDVGNVEFIVSDHSKALDQARELAMADAKRKAELYARVSGVELGRVASISEATDTASPTFSRALAAPGGASAVPVAAGEDTLRIRVTVGYDLNR